MMSVIVVNGPGHPGDFIGDHEPGILTQPFDTVCILFGKRQSQYSIVLGG